eukprot:6490102-Amphidinium_carterae.1
MDRLGRERSSPACHQMECSKLVQQRWLHLSFSAWCCSAVTIKCRYTLFQETHCDSLDVTYSFEGWHSYHSMHPAGRTTGGVSLYVRAAWLAKLSCDTCSFTEVCPGRIAQLDIAGACPMRLVVVHLVRDHLHTWRELVELALGACDACTHPLILL